MYLRELRLWNFRKFGSGSNNLDLQNPNLSVPLKEGLNVLIGENDSGKSVLIDAIKYVLKTHSWEWIRIDEQNDFHKDSNRFRIECEFFGFTDNEAKHFTEWFGWEGEGEESKPYLVVFIDVSKRDGRLLPFEVRAGLDEDGDQMSAEARDYLKTTYLKPLRDAQAELVPKRYSRLSQILQGHEAFKDQEKDHYLTKQFDEFNKSINNYFEGKKANNADLPDEEKIGKKLKDEIDAYLNLFSNKSSLFQVTEASLKQILERLELAFKDEINLGLGSHNLLFMAAELLHLKKSDWSGLRLGLVEEVEAHLHPQVQLQVIESLQKEKNIQLIFTTHSPNIGSKVKLDNLIICHNGEVFPMAKGYTKLRDTDYTFLERFLDVTKANLFFARGVILVEGWSEELFIPVLAEKIGVNLTKKGVSVINVGNTAALRYSSIFQRNDDKEFNLPVAVVSDLDVKPDDENIELNGSTKKDTVKNKKEEKYNGGSVKTFVSPHWTLEYCLARSIVLRKYLFDAIKNAGKEMRNDGYSGKTVDVDWGNFITNKNDEQIAFDIYTKFIIQDSGSKKISKTIIAQHLAETLKELDEEGLRQKLLADPKISYLIEAINYASGN